MNKIVFNNIMQNQVVQKSVIFASVFGVSITQWRGSNEKDKFPYRIYFYQGNNIVGYIDSTVSEFGADLFPKDEFPFVFFSPIGNIEGKFNASAESFSYDIDKQANNFDAIHGIVQIRNPQRFQEKEYSIGSYVNLKNKEKPLLNVSFNGCVGQAEISVESHQQSFEEVKYWINDEPRIMHRHYTERNKEELLAEIRFTQNDGLGILYAMYEFPPKERYQKIVYVEELDTLYNPIWHRIRKVSLNSAYMELIANNPRYTEFLKEVREEMIIYTGNSKPISLYDRMATISFNGPRYQNSFELTNAKRDGMDLENNPVLRKMREYTK